MILKKNIIFFFLILILITSCSKPSQYYVRDRYVVTSKNLNIRIDPTRLSRTLGTLNLGDTITALASDKYWIMVKVDNQTGFVSNEYLKKLGPTPTPRLISRVEKWADWKVWQFWVISIFLLSLWIITEIWLMKYENQLKTKFGVNTKNISITPLIFFVVGVLTGILFLYWKEQVVESVFHNFSILPKGMGSIAWIIWVQLLTLVLGMIIDMIGSIYRSGLKYGYVTFLMEQGTNFIIFFTSFFLVISAFVAAIIFLIVFFSILYTIIVTENSKSFSAFLAGKN